MDVDVSGLRNGADEGIEKLAKNGGFLTFLWGNIFEKPPKRPPIWGSCGRTWANVSGLEGSIFGRFLGFLQAFADAGEWGNGAG